MDARYVTPDLISRHFLKANEVMQKLTEIHSRSWTSRHHEHMGLHQLLRRLPDLLRDSAQPATERHLMGRKHANFLPLLRRYLHRSPHRRRIFPACVPAGFIPRRLRYLHGLPVYHLLAALPRARCMLRPGKRMSLLPQLVVALYVFQQEERSCAGDWRCW